MQLFHRMVRRLAGTAPPVGSSGIQTVERCCAVHHVGELLDRLIEALTNAGDRPSDGRAGCLVEELVKEVDVGSGPLERGEDIVAVRLSWSAHIRRLDGFRGAGVAADLLMIHPEPLGHRLHRLALTIQHQPAQIQLTLGPLVRPRQPALGREPSSSGLTWSISSGVTNQNESEQDHMPSRISGSDTRNKVLLAS
jgi:hypothetical protein